MIFKYMYLNDSQKIITEYVNINMTYIRKKFKIIIYKGAIIMLEKLGAYFNNFKKEDEDIYDEDIYDEGYETEEDFSGYQETPREEIKKPSIFSMGSSRNTKQRTTIDPNTVRMQIFKPSEYEDSKEIIMLLKKNEAVVLNLEFVSKEDGRRIVDTVSGGITALDGQIVKVTNSIFIAVPKNYQIEGGFEKRRKSYFN